MRAGKKSAKYFARVLLATLIVLECTTTAFFPFSVSAASGGTTASSPLGANGDAGTALGELKEQTAEVATSAELKQASTSLWSLAWQKSRSFLTDMTFKFFGLFRIAWDSLVSAFKGTPSTDANANMTPQ